MLKRSLALGFVSGLLAGLVSLLYARLYYAPLADDFSTAAGNLAKPANIVILSVIGGMIAGIGYWLLDKWFKRKGEPIFNFVFVILSFATLLGAFGAKLPLTVGTPELFPGLVVPMHLFPALAWFTLKPLFMPR